MDKQIISIPEIIKDPIFIKQVEINFKALVNQRKNRPEAPVGKRYIRNWYDRMSSEGLLHKETFINNISDIWQKKSQLSSEIRSVIKFVCDRALFETLKIKEVQQINQLP